MTEEEFKHKMIAAVTRIETNQQAHASKTEHISNELSVVSDKLHTMDKRVTLNEIELKKSATTKGMLSGGIVAVCVSVISHIFKSNT